MALKIPDIDSYDSLMHTLFALEDIYGLTVVSDANGELVIQEKPLKRKTRKNFTRKGMP